MAGKRMSAGVSRQGGARGRGVDVLARWKRAGRVVQAGKACERAPWRGSTTLTRSTPSTVAERALPPREACCAGCGADAIQTVGLSAVPKR